MNIRLAYSSNAYMRFDVFEAIRRISALGYHGIELMADAPHLWPQETDRAKIEAVRKCLDEHKRSISNINAFMMSRIGDKRQPYWHPSWIEPDRTYRQIRIDHTKAALTMAKHLGAPHITTEPGGPISAASTYSKSLDVFVEELKPVVGHAEKEQIKLLVEPEPELLIERFEQYLELSDRIDSPFLGLNFDIGHSFCVGQEPADWIPKVQGCTSHYHIEDIPASREHRHLVPGQGGIDFKSVLSAIDSVKYDGWITVELYPYIDDPDAAGREAKAHLERIAATI